MHIQKINNTTLAMEYLSNSLVTMTTSNTNASLNESVLLDNGKTDGILMLSTSPNSRRLL